jgi:thiopeptide-type bacteriocin biosynthesis protein
MQSLEFAYEFNGTTHLDFDEGIYLASPELWQELKKEEYDSSKKKKKEMALLKYWLRSCTRSTPFGLFAGITVVSASENKGSSVILSESYNHTRIINLEWNSLLRIITSIVQIPIIQNQIKFYKNNTIYSVINEYRYVEYSVINNNRKYELTSVKKTNYIEAILEFAAEGATKPILVNHMISNFEASSVEANDFINDLISSQLLIAELEPSITGGDQLEHLINQLKKLNGISELILKLEDLFYQIRHPKSGAQFYKNLEMLLQETKLLPKSFKNNFYTDLHIKTSECKIDSQLIQKITTQAEDLLCFSQSFQNENLINFINIFNDRHEGKMIPLAIALDAEIGIGYAEINNESTNNIELINDLHLDNKNHSRISSNNHIKEFSLNKYLDFLKSGNGIIEITNEDLTQFNNTNVLPLPNSIYLLGNLLKKGDILNAENFQFHLKGAGGPSAANLSGRFAQGNSLLLGNVKNIIEVEEKQNPEAIFAEIAHLPSMEKLGNVILRPVLRQFEIPYVTKSGASSENQILIDDILICIINNEIVLFSKKYNKRIIPRLTSAHNFNYKSLPVYKFLCDLQFQGSSYPVFWDWGNLVSEKLLPRVVYKNLILKKARWNFTLSDISDLPLDDNNFYIYFRKFCAKFTLPNQVEYVEGDNLLLIDFERLEGINIFLYYLKKNSNIIVEEFLFNKENSFVVDEKNRTYTNEIVIPLYRNISITEKEVHINKNASYLKSKFTPNSEWLYFKIYGSPKLLEKILIKYILPFIEESLEGTLFEKYFFIRFKDESYHLRIRFYNRDITKQGGLQESFISVLQPLVANGMIQNIIIDTYNREIERYGSNCMEESESLFFNDSLCTMRFIKLLEGVDSEKYRLLFALRGIDFLLNDFMLDTIQKCKLLEALNNAYFEEFGALPILLRQLKDKYRFYKNDIFSHMDIFYDKDNDIEEGIGIFKQRSDMNIIPIKKLLVSFNTSDFEKDLTNFLSSHIHMFVNRLFIVKQRKFELVIYHFLHNYYKSRLAIKKLQPNKYV